MKTAVIYVIGFPNGKLYVGRTVQRVARRFQGHCRSKQPVGRAIRKYGPENCRLIVLHSDVSWSEAGKLEQWYISELETRSEKNGYNLTDGGEGQVGRKVSRKCREAVSKAVRRLWNDPSDRAKMLAAVQKNLAKAHSANRGRKLVGSHLAKIQAVAAQNAKACRGIPQTGERLAKSQAAIGKAREAKRLKDLARKEANGTS